MLSISDIKAGPSATQPVNSESSIQIIAVKSSAIGWSSRMQMGGQVRCNFPSGRLHIFRRADTQREHAGDERRGEQQHL